MRSKVVRVLLSVAATIVLASFVSTIQGQARLTAFVPFPFTTGTAPGAAGHYEIDPNYVSGVTMLHNIDNRSYVAILRQGSLHDPVNGRARLVFRCVESGCALSQIFTGADGWQLSTPKPSPAEKERLAVVYFTAGKAN